MQSIPVPIVAAVIREMEMMLYVTVALFDDGMFANSARFNSCRVSPHSFLVKEQEGSGRPPAGPGGLRAQPVPT